MIRTKRTQGKAYLHANVGITHASIHSQFCQLLATVHLHGIENGLCLETCGLHGCAGNMSSLCVVGDTPCDVISGGVSNTFETKMTYR